MYLKAQQCCSLIRGLNWENGNMLVGNRQTKMAFTRYDGRLTFSLFIIILENKMKKKKIFPKSKCYPGEVPFEFFYIHKLKASLWIWVFLFLEPIGRTGSFSAIFWQAWSSGRPWHWSWCRGEKMKCQHRPLFLANYKTECHNLVAYFFSAYDLYHLYHALLSFNTHTHTYTFKYVYMNLLINK